MNAPFYKTDVTTSAGKLIRGTASTIREARAQIKSQWRDRRLFWLELEGQWGYRAVTRVGGCVEEVGRIYV